MKSSIIPLATLYDNCPCEDLLHDEYVTLHLFTKYKIESIMDNDSEFLSDDLVQAMQSSNSFIATNKEMCDIFKDKYPHFYKYEVKVKRLL